MPIHERCAPAAVGSWSRNAATILCVYYVRKESLKMTIYGYARVSTTGQSLEAQLAELKAAGATKIFQEKITGKHRNRAQLDRVLKTLGEGDVLIVSRLDRLARSSCDLLNIIKQLT